MSNCKKNDSDLPSLETEPGSKRNLDAMPTAESPFAKKARGLASIDSDSESDFDDDNSDDNGFDLGDFQCVKIIIPDGKGRKVCHGFVFNFPQPHMDKYGSEALWNTKGSNHRAKFIEDMGIVPRNFAMVNQTDASKVLTRRSGSKDYTIYSWCVVTKKAPTDAQIVDYINNTFCPIYWKKYVHHDDKKKNWVTQNSLPFLKDDSTFPTVDTWDKAVRETDKDKDHLFWIVEARHKKNVLKFLTHDEDNLYTIYSPGNVNVRAYSQKKFPQNLLRDEDLERFKSL